MIKILSIFLISLVLAWFSEQQTNQCRNVGQVYRMRNDPAFLLLCLMLSLFAGLRTEYNDTWNYMHGFATAPDLQTFLSNPDNYNLFQNFLFNVFQGILKNFTNNAQVLIFLSSAFIQTCMMVFLKRYSKRFTFSVFLYFCLGTFCVTLAAIKQTLAMAILTLSFPYLEKKRFLRFFLIVFIAMQFHTYAVCFAILPFLLRKPWRSTTFLFFCALIFVLSNFTQSLSEFMEYANSLGKNLEEYEVFDESTINLFRVAVYAVPPLFSLVFARWINRGATSKDYLFIHMSIISLGFMLMGTQSGANMFARMAHYFEIGTLCTLANTIDKPFSQNSMRLVYTLTVICFLGFFLYANLDFDAAYQGLGILGIF